MSIGQQSLPELRLAVRVDVSVARHAGQLHRLVEGVFLRCLGLPRFAHC